MFVQDLTYRAVFILYWLSDGANAGAYADFDDKAHQEAAVPSSYQDSVAAGGYQQPGFQAP